MERSWKKRRRLGSWAAARSARGGEGCGWERRTLTDADRARAFVVREEQVHIGYEEFRRPSV